MGRCSRASEELRVRGEGCPGARARVSASDCSEPPLVGSQRNLLVSLTAARHCEAQTPTRSLRHKESHGRGKWSQVGSLIGVETCAARFVELCLRPSADPSFSPWGTPNFGEGLQRLGSPLIARAASGESPDGPTIHPLPTRTRASSLSSESRGDFPEDALALRPAGDFLEESREARIQTWKEGSPARGSMRRPPKIAPT